MARGKKQRHRSVPESRVLAERELAKGNCRLALKHAKVCYRQDPAEPSRQLLQRAYLARCGRLRQDRLLDQARVCLQELISLGAPPAGCEEEVARLGVLLGVEGAADRANGGPLDCDPRLLAAVADQALVCSQANVSAPRQVMEDAATIRRALAAIEADDNAGAHALLASISRTSPLADWKLFARGLAAYYANDRERVSSNWSRLDCERPAHRIAEALLVLASERSASQVSAAAQALIPRLTYAFEQRPITAPLTELITAWKAGSWSGIVQRYRELAWRARAVEPELLARVTDIVWKRLVRDRAEAHLPEFVRHAPAPATDPQWNRLRALLADQGRCLDCLEARWQAYLDDIEQTGVFTEGERPLAVGLISYHVAQQLVESAEHLARDANSPDFPEPEEEILEELEATRASACAWFDRSLESNAAAPDVAMDYARLLTNMGDAQRATQVYSDLCHNLPDEFEAWMALALHLTGQEAFSAAKPHLKRALSLRPRSGDAHEGMWAACVGVARQAALAGQFGLAYAELDEAAAFRPAGRDACILDAHRAAVAYKEKNTEKATSCMEAFLSHFDQPAGGLLVLASLACRYHLGQGVKKSLNDQLKEAVRRKATGPSAGAMARYLHALTVRNVDYFGIKGHRDTFLGYLNRCGRVAWEAADLRDACQCVRCFQTHPRLLRKLVRNGRRRFPDDPHFHAYEGILQMERSPLWASRRKARHAFETALALAKEGSCPLDPALQRACSKGLSVLNAPPSRIFRPHRADDFADDADDSDGNEGSDGKYRMYGRDLGHFTNEEMEDFKAGLPPRVLESLHEASRALGIDINDLIRKIASGGVPGGKKPVRRGQS